MNVNSKHLNQFLMALLSARKWHLVKHAMSTVYMKYWKIDAQRILEYKSKLAAGVIYQWLICCSYVNSGSNLVLLCWSCVLARHAYTNTELCNDAQWIRLVEVQCLTLHGVLSAGTTCVCQAARKKLHRVWKEVWCKLLL